MILYTKLAVQKIRLKLIKKIRHLKHKPTLAVVLVGNNPVSLHFVTQKEKTALGMGCKLELFRIKNNAPQIRVISLIEKLNKDKRISGIIVQLPLPSKCNTEQVVAAIRRSKDIDNLRGDALFIPPTVQAIWQIMAECKSQDAKRKKILIVGYGRLVGKPLHAFLKKKGFKKISLADIYTKNLDELTLGADIIVSGVGKPNLIKNVKKGAIVIDAGSSPYKGKIVGDVDFERVSKKARFITPVPGGVGPLTVAYLFKNLLLARRRYLK